MASNQPNLNTAMEAITYHQENGEVSTNGEAIGTVPQPRQPNNLQGLLRFAVEAGKTEENVPPAHVGPLDDERRRFLDSALRSMTVDISELLLNQIAVLQGVDNFKPENDVQPYISAIETILEHVDNIDIANDFCKMHGLKVLEPCLKCFHPGIRGGAGEIIAELCQNNPYCQRMIVVNNFIPLILKTLASENDSNVCIKLLYAFSCIVRNNPQAFQHLLQYEGLTVLSKMLQKDNEKLTIKTTFLLSSLCRSNPDLISRLVLLDFVPILLTLLSKERGDSTEHILSLLLLLVEDSGSAVSECKDRKYNLKEILQNNLQIIKNKEEFQEEELCCVRLLELLFK